MITVQINADDFDSITNRDIVDKLSSYEKFFIKKETIDYDLGNGIVFTEYNKSSLTYIPPYVFKYKLMECKSILW